MTTPKKAPPTLRSLFEDWTHTDDAIVTFGLLLGVFEEGADFVEETSQVWSVQPTTDNLYSMLNRLTSLGHLQYNHDTKCYRWKREEASEDSEEESVDEA